MSRFYPIMVLLLGLSNFGWSQATYQEVQPSGVGPLPQAADNFGYAIDLNSDAKYFVVGSPFSSAIGNGKGLGYVFFRLSSNIDFPTNTFDTIAPPNTIGNNANFGSSVTINSDGTRILVGAPKDGTTGGGGQRRGSIWFFSRSMENTWTLVGGGIQPAGVGQEYNFGHSLSLDGLGDFLAVGAPGITGNNFPGSVYIFTFTAPNYSHNSITGLITNPTPVNQDNFGCSVSLDLDGNTLVVGAYGDDTGGTNRGAAYIYTRSGDNWTLAATLDNSSVSGNLNDNSFFGSSVDISDDGNVVVVGAPGYSEAGTTTSGAAFLFRNNGSTWVQEKKFIPLNDANSFEGANNDEFGYSVSLDGSGRFLLIGAPNRDSGRGEIYSNTYSEVSSTWKQNFGIPALTADSGAEGAQTGDRFGSAVALGRADEFGVVSSPLHDYLGASSIQNVGSCYSIQRNALPVTWLPFTAKLNDEGGADLLWSTASEANNKGFNVQRSPNGRDWQTIHFEEGAGTTSERQDYSYTDNTLSTLNSTLVYYRLEQVDEGDGATDYSPLRVIELEGEAGGIRVFPNPASEEVTIGFAEPTEARGTVRLFTQNRRFLAEYPIAPQSTEYSLRVSTLPSGTYILVVKVGNREWTKRLVVE